MVDIKLVVLQQQEQEKSMIKVSSNLNQRLTSMKRRWRPKEQYCQSPFAKEQ